MQTWTLRKLRRNFSLVARYSFKFTCCLVLVVKSLVTRCKIRSLLAAEVARCKNSLVTRCRSCLLQKFTRYSLQNSLVKRCRSCSLQKFTRYSLQNSLVTRCKNSFVVKNHSLLVAKFDRYLLHKFTKKSQLNLVMGDKI